MALLSVSELGVDFVTRGSGVRAVDRVSFELENSEIVGLVGESGSGKSVTSLALLGLLSGTSAVTRGAAHFGGQDLMTLSDTKLRHLRGNRIALVFQDPLTSLNPYLTLEDQLCEVAEVHLGHPHKQARERAVELLTRVGIGDAARRIREYPHQLSGGMRQRVCIAMALLCDPELLILDEPTTMLDVTIQAQILDLLRELRRERKMSILLITHDLGVVAELADRVLVMYAGRIVESAPTAELFARPLHPYTEALLQSTPRIDLPHGGTLRPIAGLPPRLSLAKVTECVFAPRCARVRVACREREPELRPESASHARRCVLSASEMEAPIPTEARG